MAKGSVRLVGLGLFPRKSGRTIKVFKIRSIRRLAWSEAKEDVLTAGGSDAVEERFIGIPDSRYIAAPAASFGEGDEYSSSLILSMTVPDLALGRYGQAGRKSSSKKSHS